eukprot:Hpha_TRINITY_DN12405_c0_g1::TRINITY_DN12405_c0_g1_i1::g.42990::m.42990
MWSVVVLVAAHGAGWEGTCPITNNGCCVTSENYPQNYPDSYTCDFRPTETGWLRLFDFFTIENQDCIQATYRGRYWGRICENIAKQYLGAFPITRDHNFVFTTDDSQNMRGFKMCLETLTGPCARGNLPDGLPPARRSEGWSGNCRQDGPCCATSGNYPNNYPTSERCSMLAGEAGRLVVQDFRVARGYQDYVQVRGVRYAANDGKWMQRIALWPGERLDWISAGPATDRGWRICFESDEPGVCRENTTSAPTAFIPVTPAPPPPTPSPPGTTSGPTATGAATGAPTSTFLGYFVSVFEQGVSFPIGDTTASPKPETIRVMRNDEVEARIKMDWDVTFDALLAHGPDAFRDELKRFVSRAVSVPESRVSVHFGRASAARGAMTLDEIRAAHSLQNDQSLSTEIAICLQHCDAIREDPNKKEDSAFAMSTETAITIGVLGALAVIITPLIIIYVIPLLAGEDHTYEPRGAQNPGSHEPYANQAPHWWVPEDDTEGTMTEMTQVSPAGSGDEAASVRANPHCPICFDEMKKIESRDTSVMVPCGHVLCTVCTKQIKPPPLCPVCRAEILCCVRKVRFTKDEAREDTRPTEPFSEEAPTPRAKPKCVCPVCRKGVGRDAEEDGGTTILAPCGHAYCNECGEAAEECGVCEAPILSRVSRVFINSTE